ncbi:MAG: hypothetical protein PF961_02640 [Planctomycetota bacterium]|nr:hypothetical protein [Planctomycetota bacterium]
MATVKKPATTRTPGAARGSSTTRRQIIPGQQMVTRPVLMARFLGGTALIIVAIVVIPHLKLATWLLCLLGAVGFVGGNLLRPLYRAPVRRKDQSFASVLEYINFGIVTAIVAAFAFMMVQLSKHTVIKLLLDYRVLSSVAAVFGLIALRDLLYRWREA